MSTVCDLDRYLFDLNGFLRVPGALNATELNRINSDIDAIPPLAPGDWHGRIQREQVEASRGIAYQQVYELGPVWESLIDHPSWFSHVDHFIGGQGTFDRWYGGLFIDENFVSLRGPHEAIGLHAGGDVPNKRTSYQVKNGHFMCMQVNVLVALHDIGPGDGATMVIPGSHKANFRHPEFDSHSIKQGASCDQVTAAIEVHLKAGEAIIFTDAISHGSAARINPGQRRILVYRYSPAFTFFRFAYRPSSELLARVTPQQRSILWPFKLDPSACADSAPALSAR